MNAERDQWEVSANDSSVFCLGQDAGDLPTLLLDLDETLVQCTQTKPDHFDVKFCINWQGQGLTFYLRKRPYCDEFLRRMSGVFRISIFTSSHRVYADKVIDYLDPTSSMIHERYYRDSCLPEKCGALTKDLSLLNVDIKRAVLVDDIPESFHSHRENGIECSPFFGDESDKELQRLETFLLGLNMEAPDLRPLLRHWQVRNSPPEPVDR
eukprot:gb/GECG01007602.1/.p1 GENE.gb/GECG01007602.1/~~gb/GECG01007602.1/.p1  ORF type:complete len:210 (+),score=17.50 gb/GECG01007602.1/:1-630(+)